MRSAGERASGGEEGARREEVNMKKVARSMFAYFAVFLLRTDKRRPTPKLGVLQSRLIYHVIYYFEVFIVYHIMVLKIN